MPMKADAGKTPAAPNPPSPRQPDALALATLAGVAVMLMVALWTMWNVNRLAERVGRLETERAAQPATVERGPDPNRIYAIETAGAPVKGSEAAPITIAEFADFECPFCAGVAPTLRKIEDVYKGQVRFVWKHLPLSIHQHAVDAALAAEAAGKQGKFWDYHDKLFANQDHLETDALRRYAEELQLDVARWERDMQEPQQQRRIEADTEEAHMLDVNVTPSFFINGRYLRGAQPFEAFARIVDEELTKLNLPVPSRGE